MTTGVEETAPEGWELRLAENGICEIPLVGPVTLGGLSISQAEEVIRGESIRRGKFVNPAVSVVLGKRRSNSVRVVGAVMKPGTYELPASQSDLLGALVLAEGLHEDADTIIELRHPPRLIQPGQTGAQFASFNGPMNVPAQTIRVDLEAAMQGGGDYRLYDGSAVMVMERPKRFIHVMGLVNQADQFEMPEDSEVRLLDAISMAGGLKLEIADKVRVMRTNDQLAAPVVIEASIRDAKLDGVSNIRLADGDVVNVEETPVTFTVGTIRDFVRFGFSSAIPGI